MTAHPRSIVVCCDGTFRSNDRSRHTNIYRLQNHYIKRELDPHYVSGIGTSTTDPIPHFTAAGGRGLAEKIKGGYLNICNRYREGDHIILIGYSRGAFIARCIASLVCRAGLLKRDAQRHVSTIYNAWASGHPAIHSFKRTTASSFPISCEYSPASKWVGARLPHRHGSPRPEDGLGIMAILSDSDLIDRTVRIKVCALFETVAAIGTPRRSPTPPSELAFVNSKFDDGIDHAFQALALHERRAQYLPIVWKSPNQEGRYERLCQCWFVGYHGDVGGGRAKEGLAHISLIWLLAKLNAHLSFEDDIDVIAAKLFSKQIHPELSWALVPPEVESRPTSGPREDAATPTMKFRSRILTNYLRPKNKPDHESYRPKVATTDSMKRFYRLFGTIDRWPRRQFWTEKGLQTENPNCPEPIRSNELLHWTVRVFTKMASCDLPKHLEAATCTSTEGTCRCCGGEYRHLRSWKIPTDKDHLGGSYHVCESAISATENWEARLMGAWLDSELNHLQDTAGKDDGNPKTFISEICREIDNMVALAGNAAGNGPA